MALALVADRPLLLILRPLGLGDLLTTVPALKALAEAFPNYRRVLATTQQLTPLIKLIKDSNGSSVIHETVAAQPLKALPESIHGSDLAVNLHGKGPQSHSILIATKPNQLWAFDHAKIPEPYRHRDAKWHPGEHETHRWCRMLETFGVLTNCSQLAIDTPPVTRLSSLLVGATIVHPGATHKARRWPPNSWIKVIRAATELGHNVVVTGASSEHRLVSFIGHTAGLPLTNILGGKTSLLDMAALVDSARLVISGDTGIAHLATALNTASIVLFGPSSPREWGPPSSTAKHRVLWHGKTGNPYADATDTGLLSITPEEVISELSSLNK